MRSCHLCHQIDVNHFQPWLHCVFSNIALLQKMVTASGTMFTSIGYLGIEQLYTQINRMTSMHWKGIRHSPVSEQFHCESRSQQFVSCRDTQSRSPGFLWLRLSKFHRTQPAQHQSSWWLNQAISIWIISPNTGFQIKNLWIHHQPEKNNWQQCAWQPGCLLHNFKQASGDVPLPGPPSHGIPEGNSSTNSSRNCTAGFQRKS